MALVAAGTIGSVTCHGWSGTLAGGRNVVDQFVRPGVDFSGFQNLHKRAPASSIQTTTVCVSLSQAAALRTTVEAMPGTVVKVVDPFAKTFPVVRVDDVQIVMRACRGNGPTVGSVAAYRVEISWTLEVVV
jgi:hypothetical protein